MFERYKKMITFIRKNVRIFIGLFFVTIFIFGFLAHNDYGMSWDEPTERQILHSNINHAYKTIFPSIWAQDYAKNPQFFDAIPDMNTSEERDHGQSVNYPLGIIDFVLKWSSDLTYYNHEFKDVLSSDMIIPNVYRQYELRHLYNFLLCFIGTIFLYFLVKLLTKRRMFGLFAVILFYASPRFFADIFYNCKDLTTLAALLIAMYFASHYIIKRDLRSALALSFFGAVCMNMRISTALFLGIIGIVCAITFIRARERATRSNWITLCTTVILCLLFYWMLTPAAWSDPISLLRYVISNSVSFRWNNPILYEGVLNMNHPTNDVFRQLPASYLPKMIAFTTPIIILVLIAFGAIVIAANAIRNLINRTIENTNAVLVAILIFTILSIVLPVSLDSTLYNSWRHLYYLYGAMIVIATAGLSLLWQFFMDIKNKSLRVGRFLVPITICAQIVLSLYWYNSNHPYEYAYYNLLAGSTPFDSYEADYWNVSAKQCLEKMLSDTTGQINIMASNYASTDALVKAAVMLKDSYRERIKFTGSDANYILYNLTYYQIDNPQNGDKALSLDECMKQIVGTKKYYCATVDGQPIMLLVQVNEQYIH